MFESQEERDAALTHTESLLLGLVDDGLVTFWGVSATGVLLWELTPQGQDWTDSQDFEEFDDF